VSSVSKSANWLPLLFAEGAVQESRAKHWQSLLFLPRAPVPLLPSMSQNSTKLQNEMHADCPFFSLRFVSVSPFPFGRSNKTSTRPFHASNKDITRWFS
jgi:hypothetical protein